MITKINTHKLLYNLLIETKFRWFRHFVLILFIGVINLNYISGVYKEHHSIVNLYAILGFYMVAYLSIIYMNIYWAIPAFLLKRKYVEYILIFTGTLLFFSLWNISSDYYIHKYYDIPHGYFSVFFDGRDLAIGLVSTCLITLFYLTSISSVVFYKHWMLNIKKVEQLKSEQLNSELNNLKNRVSPDFLFDKLRRAAGYCFTTPPYTSRILLQLSRVLRYQLYDCSREMVLLSSEIKYLNDYLGLEKLCNEKFDYKITHLHSTTNYLIPPLLLISLVEDSLKKLAGQDGSILIKIEINITDAILTFNIIDNRFIADIREKAEDHLLLYRQLELMQNSGFSLSSNPDEYLNQYKTVFQYKLNESIRKYVIHRNDYSIHFSFCSFPRVGRI